MTTTDLILILCRETTTRKTKIITSLWKMSWEATVMTSCALLTLSTNWSKKKSCLSNPTMLTCGLRRQTCWRSSMSNFSSQVQTFSAMKKRAKIDAIKTN